MANNYRKSSRAAHTSAPSGPKQKRRLGRSRTPKPVQTPKKSSPRPGRQQEILGVLLMALALLWSLSVVSYNPVDSERIGDKDFWQLFFPEVGGAAITNSLGPVGAYLANLVMPYFFGFTSLLVTTLVAVWGYFIMRRKRLRQLLYPSCVTLIVMGYAAVLMARVGLDISGWDSSSWAGGLGTAAGIWLHSVLGSIGSYGLLMLILVVGLMIVVDGDLQRTFDRIENFIRGIPAAFKPPPGEDKESKHGLTTWEELDGEAPAESARVAPPDPDPVHESAPVRKPAPASEKPAAAKEPSAEVTKDAPPSDIELKVYSQVAEEKATKVVRKPDGARDALPYTFPSLDLLDRADGNEAQIDFDELEENKAKLLDKLAVYKLEITNINAVVGPTVTLYELTPAPSVKISQIKSRENDLAMTMAARGIRMIVPIPGKSAVGVEIPNRKRELVRIKQIIGTTKFAQSQMELPIALGKTIEGEVFLQDLTKMPHLLIAGATGSGKSVGLNALITGLLYASHPTNLKFVMVDPKKIELQQYRNLREHFLAIPEDGDESIITEVGDALTVLRACLLEMEARYTLLSDARVRTVREYNEAFREGTLEPAQGHKHLPYIVVIVDELADLMMTAGRDIESPIARLAQMARAVGIHLVLATQRPSVDVITGLIKANFPSRIAFQVASKIDARTILDQNGAEQLVGNGDMLYMNGSQVIRLQGPFVSVKEIDRIVEFICTQRGHGPYRLPAVEESSASANGSDAVSTESVDELFEEAARIIVRAQQGSVSLLQRKLSIGYTRAARIVDELERIGVVGAFQGAKAREVLIRDELQLDALLKHAN